MKNIQWSCAVVALAAAAGAPACKKHEDTTVARTGTARAALEPCDPVNTDISMVVHDQATIGAADFSFARTIGAIRNTSGGAPTTDEALVDTILDSMLATSFTNPVSGLAMAVDVRSAEAALNPTLLLSTQMRPIALFNRFDLMPASGANCGEYRIVYGRYPNGTFDRFLLIFEAKLPNPNPGLGQAGCLPVAQFWHSLSDPSLTPAARATLLASFYYSGLSGFSPVVTHANYGVPFGQVRSNMFRQDPWELREWRTGFNGSGQPIFTVDTDKQNPLAEFFDETSFTLPLFLSEQAAFRTDFTSVQMPIIGNQVVPFSVSARCDVANAIGSAFPNRFNEFMGVSQGSSDNHRVQASTAFRSEVGGALGSLPFNVDQMLNRSTTQTCGGCHMESTQPGSNDIGLGQTWPDVAAGGFVHVRELGAAPPAITPLSQALTECFLPLRKLILEDFVCDASNPPDAGVPDTGPADTGVVPDSGAPDSGVVSCNIYSPCGPYELCDFGPYNVCGAAGDGVCQPRPTSCSYGTPVCGCDGVTYPSECHAHQAGTDVAHDGACQTCGPAPADCCFTDGDCATRKASHCVGEDCSSNTAGVCKEIPPAGYCWEDSDCAKDERCDGEQVCPCGALCIVPDQLGTCVKRPSTSPGPAPVPIAPVNVATANVVTANATLADVEAAKSALLSATTPQEAAAALEDLNNAIEAMRAQEAAEPGAFFQYRRTH